MDTCNPEDAGIPATWKAVKSVVNNMLVMAYIDAMMMLYGLIIALPFIWPPIKYMVPLVISATFALIFGYLALVVCSRFKNKKLKFVCLFLAFLICCSCGVTDIYQFRRMTDIVIIGSMGVVWGCCIIVMLMALNTNYNLNKLEKFSIGGILIQLMSQLIVICVQPVVNFFGWKLTFLDNEYYVIFLQVISVFVTISSTGITTYMIWNGVENSKELF
uniref:Uncharacterized protein n=1 Tax=Panagrolaimus superbus TaxID=310955 RepID=A0A914YBG0_9BILA